MKILKKCKAKASIYTKFTSKQANKWILTKNEGLNLGCFLGMVAKELFLKCLSEKVSCKDVLSYALKVLKNVFENQKYKNHKLSN